jgi:hypothetical protein
VQDFQSETEDPEIQDDRFSVSDQLAENSTNGAQEKQPQIALASKRVPQLTLVHDPKRQKLAPKNPLTG